MTSLAGRCHCGNIEFTFESSLPPEQLPVRECSCSFCIKHGMRASSDPNGRLSFDVHAPRDLVRYRFGLKTADFLLCRRCGIYVGAVLQAGRDSYAIINLNALDSPQSLTQAPTRMNYDAETGAGRIARRKSRWTPVASFVERG